MRIDFRFSATAVLSLAVGIGANTAIFSLANGVLLRPLPYPDAALLVTIREVIPKLAHLYPTLPVNLNHYVYWRKHATAMESIALLRPTSLNLTGLGEPELLNGARVSANTFRALRVRPRLGRDFLEAEDPQGHDQVVLLSDSLWKRRFAADPAIVGRKILLDGRPFEVVGVLPPGFQLPVSNDIGQSGMGPKTDIFKPMGYTPDDLEETEGDFNYAAIARVRPGVTAQTAIAELNVLQAEISSRLSEKMDLHVALTSLHEQIVSGARRGLLLLLGAVGAVLLILCVNLANLSLARVAGRAREFAIRTALGAGRGQLIRRALAESMLLSLAGGALGVALAWGGIGMLTQARP